MELKTRIENELLPFLEKPARFLGNEHNAVIKPAESPKLKIALCFPDLYEAGIRNVSFELLYHLLNTGTTFSAERVYAPWTDAEKVMREKNLPLFSLETRTALTDFDVVAVYMPSELTATNVLNMLDLGGLPLRASQREAQMPLVVGAGPAFNNPEPMAAFFDAIVIGEPDQALADVARCVAEQQDGGHSRAVLLRDLAGLTGLYIPQFYQPRRNDFGEFLSLQPVNDAAPARIEKRLPEKDAGSSFPLRPLVPLAEIGNHRHVFEDIAGFTEAERQNTGSRLAAPLSRLQLENLFWESQKIWRRTEGTQVSALMVNDTGYSETFWSAIKEKALVENQKIHFSATSLTLMISRTELAEFAAALKAYGFTMSPVAGTQRLRAVLNHNVRDHELLSVLKVVLEKGWPLVRLNFMVGLPTEKDEDIEAIARFVQKCLEIAAPYSEVQLQIFLQGFSPRSHTPFQWEQQASDAVLNGRMTRLKNLLAELPVQVFQRDTGLTSLETTFFRGDRRFAEVVEKAWEQGARFDYLRDMFRGPLWQTSFEACGIDAQTYLSSLSITVALPWDHIEVGAPRTQLKAEKLEAFSGSIRPENKNRVSIGYGVPRSEFEAMLKANPAFQDSSGAAAAPISYGRRGKKKIIPTAVIKRRLRVRYSKTGLARFLSHADVIRTFSRAAQMAGIPLVHSQGIRKSPKVSYGTPLPPGCASSAEYLDMEVELGREMDIQHQFNCYLPEGIQILQYQGVQANTPALAASINRADYALLLGDFGIPEDWVESLMNQSETRIERTGKEQVRELDIRPFIHELRCEDNQLRITADYLEGKSARITEILEALFEPHGVDYRQFPIQRTGQFVVQGQTQRTPFEVI